MPSGDAMRPRSQFGLDGMFTATAWCAGASFLIVDLAAKQSLLGLFEMPAIVACGAAALTCFFGSAKHSLAMAISVFSVLLIGLGCFAAVLLAFLAGAFFS